MTTAEMTRIAEYEEKITALLARVSALEGEWQPIESAPKPRIYILLYFPARDAVGVGMWSATNQGWWLTSLNGGGIADGELVPTHWMALPAPPVSEDQREVG